MKMAGDITEIWKTGTFRLWTISVKFGQQAEQGVLLPKITSIFLRADFDRNPDMGLGVMELMYNSLPQDPTLLLSVLVVILFTACLTGAAEW